MKKLLLAVAGLALACPGLRGEETTLCKPAITPVPITAEVVSLTHLLDD
jgi:hypothetical protein